MKRNFSLIIMTLFFYGQSIAQDQRVEQLQHLSIPSIKKLVCTDNVNLDDIEAIPTLALIYHSHHSNIEAYLIALENFTTRYGKFEVLVELTNIDFLIKNKKLIQRRYFNMSSRMMDEKWYYKELLIPLEGLESMKKHATNHEYQILQSKTNKEISEQLKNRDNLFYFEYSIVPFLQTDIVLENIKLHFSDILDLIIYGKIIRAKGL